MRVTPGQALHRARKGKISSKDLCHLLSASSSHLWYVENTQRTFPVRWLEHMPPDIAIPVIDALIAEKRQELHELDLLREMTWAESETA